jgi:hypothetical protein
VAYFLSGAYTADTARKQGWNVLDALKTPSPILIARLKAA